MSNWISEEAEAKLAARAVIVAKARECSAEEALAYVTELYPDLVKAANGGRTYVAKATGAWSDILAGARAMIEKSGAELSESQAIDKYLKTADGKAAYEVYRSERGA
jgi:hypothetical protein